MPVTRARAQQLLTKAEFEFVAQSWSPAIREHSPARLRQKVSRARRLRDKFRDESRRQAGEAKGKRSPRSTRAAQGNRNTELKGQIFDEALKRFEDRLDQLEAAPPPAPKKAAPVKKAAPTKKETTATKAATGAKATTAKKATPAKATATAKKATTAKKGATGKKSTPAATATARKASSTASKGARKDAKITQSGAKKTQTHARARTGRTQAKRDGR